MQLRDEAHAPRRHTTTRASIRIAGLLLGAAVLLGPAAAFWEGGSSVAQRVEIPPLYVTIVVHNEEDTSRGVLPKAQIPDYDGDAALMAHFADAMRAFAEMAQSHGARINFGSDWTFSRGVAAHEPTFYVELDALGHEIDAHAHESSVRYHEVRDEILVADGNPTDVASGMNEEEIEEQLEYFDRYYPEFRVLWGVALPGHDAGECIAAWVWRPSRDDWTKHDPRGRYIYVGHGELVNSFDAVRRGVAARRADRVNTIALFVSPREFKAAAGTAGIEAQWTAPTDSVHFWRNRIELWDDLLDEIDALVDVGAVAYASLTEIVSIFEEKEAAGELDFAFGEVPRSYDSMRARNLRAGYPLD